MGNDSFAYAWDIVRRGVDMADKRMLIRKAVKAHPKCPYTGVRLFHGNTVVVEVKDRDGAVGVSVMHWSEWANYREHTLRWSMRAGQLVFIHDGRTLFRQGRRWWKRRN